MMIVATIHCLWRFRWLPSFPLFVSGIECPLGANSRRKSRKYEISSPLDSVSSKQKLSELGANFEGGDSSTVECRFKKNSGRSVLCTTTNACAGSIRVKREKNNPYPGSTNSVGMTDALEDRRTSMPFSQRLSHRPFPCLLDCAVTHS